MLYFLKHDTELWVCLVCHYSVILLNSGHLVFPMEILPLETGLSIKMAAFFIRDSFIDRVFH